jgi:hypothetical protein
MAAWARENAPLCGPADHEAFCDYWHGIAGAKGRKIRWDGAWKNWMRREQETRTTRNRASNGHRPSTTDQRMAQGAELIARLEAQRAPELEA